MPSDDSVAALSVTPEFFSPVPRLAVTTSVRSSPVTPRLFEARTPVLSPVPILRTDVSVARATETQRETSQPSAPRSV